MEEEDWSEPVAAAQAEETAVMIYALEKKGKDASISERGRERLALINEDEWDDQGAEEDNVRGGGVTRACQPRRVYIGSVGPWRKESQEDGTGELSNTQRRGSSGGTTRAR